MLTRAYPKQATLKNGRQVVIRPLNEDDFDGLYGFFRALPEDDRLFLRNDVTDPELIRKWVENIDLEHVIPLIALEGDKVVADGTLHWARHGWTMHVGQIRMVTARTHRGIGLGTLMARELVALAEERGLEKLHVDVIEDNVGSVRMCERVGFKLEAVLKDMVKDQKGTKRNLAIMVSEVTDLGRIMEDWIQDAMVPAFRVPDDGVA